MDQIVLATLIETDHSVGVCGCVCVSVCVCLSVFLSVCLSVRPSVCLSICLSLLMRVFVYLIKERTNKHTHTHTHTHTSIIIPNQVANAARIAFAHARGATWSLCKQTISRLSVFMML